MERNTEVADLIRGNNIGFEIREGDVDGLVAAIQKLKNDPVLRKDISKHARKILEVKYEAEVVINSFEEILVQKVNL